MHAFASCPGHGLFRPGHALIPCWPMVNAGPGAALGAMGPNWKHFLWRAQVHYQGLWNLRAQSYSASMLVLRLLDWCNKRCTGAETEMPAHNGRRSTSSRQQHVLGWHNMLRTQCCGYVTGTMAPVVGACRGVPGWWFQPAR